MKNTQRVEIPVMHSFDNNYVIPAAVSFHSMLKYADPQYDYRLFVLHSDITWQNQEKLTKLVEQFPNASIEFMNMSHQFDGLLSQGMDHGHLTKEVLYKLLAPSIFPQYDRMIITDVDVIFQGDIAPSYFVFEQNSTAYYAGVRQINPPGTFLRDYYNNCYKKELDAEEFSQIKICGGYLVVNLKQLREDGMEDAMVQYLKDNVGHLPQLEQDVINFCCREEQIIYLPLDYVVCSYMYGFRDNLSICTSDPFYSFKEFMGAMDHPVQLHYATSTKPWKKPDSEKADVWFAGLEETDFLQDYHDWWNGQSDAVPQEEMPGKRYFAKNPPAPATCKVSVLCCTYNHEKYIDKALESILGQKTNFDFEVIVADDASTDGTQKIIRKYMQKHPERMKKCILRSKNVGIGPNYYEALSAATGEYLALCDGDDRWIDMEKLQKQVDYLEKHKDYMMVCSNFKMHFVDDPDKDDQTFDIKQYTGKKQDRFTVRDLITLRFASSCTTMYRWQLRGRVPEFLKHYKVIDFPLSMLHSSCGYIGIINEELSMYNVHSNSISNRGQKELAQQLVTVLYEVNQMLGFRLSKTINAYQALVKGKTVQSAATGTENADELARVQAIMNAPKDNVVQQLLPAIGVPYVKPTGKQAMLLFYHDHCPELVKKACRALVPKKLRNKITGTEEL